MIPFSILLFSLVIPFFSYSIKQVAYLRVAMISIVLSTIIHINSVYFMVFEELHFFHLYNDFFSANMFNFYFEILVYILAILYFIALGERLSGKKEEEVVILVLFSVLGALLVMYANDFISLFIGIEGISFSLYVLVSININQGYRYDLYSTIYFFVGSFSSISLLFGMTEVYATFGISNFHDLFLLFDILGPTLENFPFGFLFILFGLFLKMGAAPFHFWAPNVYDAFPNIIAMWVINFTKIPLVYILYYFKFLYIHFNPILVYLVIFSSLVVGALGGVTQKSVRRLIAFSSINHSAFIIAAVFGGTLFSIFSFILYFFQYILTNILLFLTLIILRGDKDVNFIKESATNNWSISLALSSILYSMGGVPPFPGFFGKLSLLFSTSLDGLWIFNLFAIFTSTISVFYYIRFIKEIYRDTQLDLYTISLINKERSGPSTFILSTFTLVNLGAPFFLHYLYYIFLLPSFTTF